MDSLCNSIQKFNKSELNQDVVTVETKITAVLNMDKPISTKGSYSFGLGHQDEKSLLEWFEVPKVLRIKAKKIAKLIQSSNHTTIYTGAGISTAAKLPDYRGADGMWTNKDNGSEMKGKYTTISNALPTFSHMAIAELVKRNLVKSVISTNVDGLHMRSGLKRLKNLAELHGNAYLEVCEKCDEQYLREDDVLQYQSAEHRIANRHWCGGICEREGCDGMLLDTIVAFKEYLPSDQLTFAEEESNKADLALVLGSTMLVSPACDLPALVARKGKMIICNLQKTPFDDDAEFLVHAYLDDLWYLIMKELDIQVPDSIQQGNREFHINYSFESDSEMDATYARKREESNKKYERFCSEIKLFTGNALTRGENPYQKSTINDRNDEILQISYEKPELAFFHRCNGCNYSLVSTCKKLVIENCSNCEFTLNGKIITSCVEIINSSNLTLHFNTSVFTVTCDNSESISLRFENIEQVDMLAWAKVTKPSLEIDNKSIDLSIFEKIDIHKDQVITKKQPDNSIVSSLTARDSCGRIL